MGDARSRIGRCSCKWTPVINASGIGGVHSLNLKVPKLA